MLVTNIGSDFWPLTSKGQALALLLSICGLAVFGCITASFASFFIERHASKADAPLTGSADVARLGEEIRKQRLQFSRSG